MTRRSTKTDKSATAVCMTCYEKVVWIDDRERGVWVAKNPDGTEHRCKKK